jgi:hypothetical protein
MNHPIGSPTHAADLVRKASPLSRLAWPGFHVSFACLILILVVAGFWSSYYGPLMRGTLAISPMLHVHGIIATAWVLFFLLQTAWIARGHRRIHRAMGWVGAVLAACMVAMGLALAIEMITVGAASDQIVDAHRFSILPLVTSVLFGMLVALAIACRRQAALHKRLMLLAMVAMMPPALVRIGLPFFGISPLPVLLGTVGLVALCMIHDLRTRGRVHPVYWIGGLLLVGSLPARFWLMQTDLWLWITQPLVSVVPT